MNLLFYGSLAVLLTGAAKLYLYAARQFGWFDTPNERSLHTDKAIVRGGGVLFYISVCYVMAFTPINQPYFFTGLTVVSLVSFWDDFRPLPIRYRLLAQSVAVAFLLWQTAPLSGQVWILAGVLIVCVGVVNAFNFMDGINGMTAFYGLVIIGTLWYCEAIAQWTAPSVLFPPILIALLIFGWFNARVQAIWFAGDVGSLSIGFICLYGLLRLIISQQTYLPVLFLSVYGVDSVLTILNRLYHRQNILRAHRLHLFQLLVHRASWSPIRVSSVYALSQLGINALVFWAMDWPGMEQFMLAGGVLGGLSIVYFLWICRLSHNKGLQYVGNKTKPKRSLFVN